MPLPPYNYDDKVMPFPEQADPTLNSVDLEGQYQYNKR